MSDPQDQKPYRVIGITGVPSVGKGEVVKVLNEWGAERGWRVGYLSFSDQIKEEARRQGHAEGDFSRELLGRLVSDMREAEGPAVLAKRILDRIEAIPQAERPELFVVEAIRHVAEIDRLRSALGDRFVVLGVTADVEVIADRLLARKRPDESREAMRGKSHARRVVLSELQGQAVAKGVHVGDCIDAADVLIENTGTLSALRESVRAAVDRLA